MAEDVRILNAAAPTLHHPDLHKRNVFVSADDPTVITGIIDWQSTSIEPAFWYSDDVPDFARSIPDLSGQTGPTSEVYAKAFHACVALVMPSWQSRKTWTLICFDHFDICYRSWKDGAVAFHNELIETSKHWEELGLSGVCPFTIPTAEVLAAHRDQYRRFEAAQDLKHQMSALLNTATDGWLPPEAWETTVVEHKEMFAKFLEFILSETPDDDEPLRSESDLRELWPFDLQSDLVLRERQ